MNPYNHFSLDEAVAHLQRLHHTAGSRDLNDAEAEEWGHLRDHVERLKPVRAALLGGHTEAGTPFGDGPDSGVVHEFRGNPWDQNIDLRTASRADLKSMALTAVERCIGGMPDAAKEYGTAALERDNDPQSRMARYVLATSSPHYLTAFSTWMREPERGHLEWTPEERDAFTRVKHLERAMSIGTTTAGGFLVPYQLDPQILISSAGYRDPMREIARVEQTLQNDTRFVTSLGVTASWDAEAAEVSDDSPALLQPAIPAFKGAAFIPLSYELFEDTAGTLAQQVGTLFADAKASLEATAFTTGAGGTTPKGIITALVAAGGATVIATGTNVLAQGDLYANQAALPARWRPNAKWSMNLSILNGYRQLPQATGLNYSVINDDGPLPKALGWDIYENNAMDGTLTGAAADYLVLSGDFSNYIIVDRLGTTVELIPHLFAPANARPTGQRGFYMHWRTGGDVVIPDAFRLSNFST